MVPLTIAAALPPPIATAPAPTSAFFACFEDAFTFLTAFKTVAFDALAAFDALLLISSPNEPNPPFNLSNALFVSLGIVIGVRCITPSFFNSATSAV